MNFEFTVKDDVESLHPNIAEFVPRYISNRKQDYEQLKTSIANRDFEAIRDYCHKVVGTARSYHFHCLEEITKELQVWARKSDYSKIRELMPSYDDYIQGLFQTYLIDITKLNK